MELSCPVSLGEVLDKISILRIKRARIKDSAKLVHVKTELERLTTLLGDLTPYEQYLAEFAVYNGIIWDVEDVLRAKNKKGEFDQVFIDCARTAFMNNDKRFAVKDVVNTRFNSTLREQKSYE